ncbi:peptidase M48 [Halobiforma lacisalsi AJ5]|uniref:Heat shock protein HtpX n=2 Tax=Natronobacterium TaxID=2256 RepID=M0LF72_NATLA|nr:MULTISPECIES: M48 family metallopeptidase [Halobiforma]APW96474.1 peptidase M48 [Halobiforma lacisalsi AJ5]EMA31753.1 heat shock protein HtpX [Halobiforma lacisalsi AJ5]SFB70380.1 Zn-dependent protease with chaperone function [Halobiforma haloterrestris]
MIRPTRLQLGLWLRLAVAATLVALGQFVVLAFEVVTVALLALIVLASLEEFLSLLFVLSVLLTGLFVCWYLLAVVVRRLYPARTLSDRLSHDGMADTVEAVGESLLSARVLANWPRTLALLGGLVVGTFVGFGLAERIAWRSMIDPLYAAATVGVLGALAHLVWLVHREWTDDAAALRDVSESVRVLERPDEEVERRRAAVQGRVDRLARQADLPSPTVRLGVTATPTAATVGYRPESSTLVVSRGLLEAVDDRELDAVLAHELAHVTNRDAAVVTALSMPAASATAILERYDYHPFVALLAGFVVGIVRWSVAVVSRYREYVADRGAVAITGDPAALASALETLDRDLETSPSSDFRHPRSTAAFAIVPPPWDEHRFFDRTRRFVARRIFGTHPPTEKRVERLRDRI